MAELIPQRGARLENLIGGAWSIDEAQGWVERCSPHDGVPLWSFPDSSPTVIDRAVAVAAAASADWGWSTAAPRRGELLLELAELLRANSEDLAGIIAAETGKAPGEAHGEVMGAVALGRFFAGEGMRLFGRTMPSALAGKRAMTVREPVGVAGLIAASNTPLANIAWKLFPALVAGNTAIVKAAESTPATAQAVGRLALLAGIPDGVVAVVHGQREVGRRLVAHPGVDVISFTGSSEVGREIAEVCGRRMARVSLELGGKNGFVVLDDADLDLAVDWAVRSAFSNAGQRCASGSRLIVTDGIYDRFLAAFVARTETLRVGPTDDDDLGPVITRTAADRIVESLKGAAADGLPILTGGERLRGPEHEGGNYVAPTVVSMMDPGHALSDIELFGPVAQVYRVADDREAVDLLNDSPYGLTAAVHTRDYHRAMRFVESASVGVVSVNGGTFGSEPHMPFGGRRWSGNGTREPGTESLEVYTSLKTVYLWPEQAIG